MKKRIVVELTNREENKLAHRFKVKCTQLKMTMKRRILSLISADLKAR